MSDSESSSSTPVTQAPDVTEDNSSSSDDDDDNKMLFLAVGISVGVLVVLAVMYFVCCRSMMKN